jgi:hypothetical protein
MGAFWNVYNDLFEGKIRNFKAFEKPGLLESLSFFSGEGLADSSFN